MKKYLFLIPVLIFTGCAGVRDWAYQPVSTQPPVVTNTVPVYVPGDLAKPAVTNLTTGVITPPVGLPGTKPVDTVIVPIQPEPVVTHEPSPALRATQDVVSTVPGYGPLIGMALALAASLGRIWLDRKQLSKSHTVAVSTVQAIETFLLSAKASGDPKAMAIADKLKEILTKAHEYADVELEIRKLLDQYTGHTTGADAVSKAIKGIV